MYPLRALELQTYSIYSERWLGDYRKKEARSGLGTLFHLVLSILLWANTAVRATRVSHRVA
jgi:hypothetical protein